MELRVEKNMLTVIVSCVAFVAVLGLVYYGFTAYKRSLSAQAQAVFMQRYAEYQKLIDTTTGDVSLLRDAVVRDHTQYQSSAYGPFFLALQAELDASVGARHEALQAMTQAVSQMTGIDPVLFYTYSTKLALMQLESEEPATQTKGRQSLEKLALMAKNPVHDMAWFYMGYQALMDNDGQGVQTAWGRLFDAQKNPLSIWGVRAQSLLNYTA